MPHEEIMNYARTEFKSLMTGCMLLASLQVTGICGLSESNYDKERDKRLKEQQRDRDRLAIQKLREAAQEKRDKQQEEFRQIRRDDHLLRHPNEFYNARVMGRYGMKDGKPVPFVPINGKISDVLDDKRILVYIPAPKTDAASGIMVLVVLEKPQALAKGQKFSIPNVISAGDYGYTRSDGTQVSSRMYTETPGITLKEFLQLKKDGYKFPEE